MSGAARPEHRCQATKRNGRRCRKYSLKGRRYCAFHGGRRSPGYKGMGRYSKHLGKTLAAAIDELMAEPSHEQVSLHEELALARTTAIEAIKLWDAAARGDKMETKALAASVLREALVFVKDMVVAVAHVEDRARDKVSIYTVNALVAQVVRAIHDVCGEDPALAQRIEAHIRERVRVPTAESVGMTDSTPDQIVKEMDDATAPGG